MEWLFIALLAIFMFSLTSIIDALSIKKYVGDAKTYLFYNMSMQGVFGIILLFFVEVSFYGAGFLFVVFLSGMFRVYGLIPYMKSLEFEEVSRMAPLFNLGPIFVLIFSIPVLGLSLSLNQYLGFALLVFGGFLISTKKIHKRFRITKGFWYMMLTNLLLTGLFVSIDYLFKNYDYWSAFVFMQLGTLMAAITMIPLKDYGQKALKKLPSLGVFAKSLVLIVALISLGGGMLRAFAIKLSSAAIVTSLGGFGSLFTLLIAIFISFKFPKLLKEELKREVIALKAVAIAFLVLGVSFIT